MTPTYTRPGNKMPKVIPLPAKISLVALFCIVSFVLFPPMMILLIHFTKPDLGDDTKAVWWFMIASMLAWSVLTVLTFGWYLGSFDITYALWALALYTPFYSFFLYNSWLTGKDEPSL